MNKTNLKRKKCQQEVIQRKRRWLSDDYISSLEKIERAESFAEKMIQLQANALHEANDNNGISTSNSLLCKSCKSQPIQEILPSVLASFSMEMNFSKSIQEIEQCNQDKEQSNHFFFNEATSQMEENTNFMSTNDNHLQKLEILNQLENSILRPPADNESTQDYLAKSDKQNNGLATFIKSKEFLKCIQVNVTISPGELFLILLKYCVKYAPSLESIAYICKIVNSIFCVPIIPETSYLINDICERQCKVTHYKLCPNCHVVLTDVNVPIIECAYCKKVVNVPKNYSSNTFALIDPSDEISELMHLYEDHYDFVVKKRSHIKGIIEDTYDGRKYRKFVQSLPAEDKHQYVTFTMNTDGAEPFKSSNDSAWPIYLMLNELPIEKRFKHIITVGVWFGKSQPKMQVYMDKFVKLIKQIRSNGIPCTIKGEERLLKPFILSSVDDTPARKKLNRKLNFNAYEGCDWCYIKGFYYMGSMRYILDGPIKLRDAETTKRYMLEATEKGFPIHGVRDISPLVFLEEFDIEESFIVDLMHAIDEGATKQETRIILNKKLKPNQRQLIDQYLLQIRAPTSIGRLTQIIKERKNWTGRQWQNWRLFYSLPILEAVGLEGKYLEQWSLLVNSLHILLGDSITTSDLANADRMLRKYVLQTQDLYGPEYMTYNIHQLLHITKSIYNFGPLQVQSTYPFETENGKLMRAVHSANGSQKQITRYISINRTAEMIKKLVYPHAHMHIKDFYEDKAGESGNVVQVEERIFFNGECESNNEIIQKFHFCPESKFFTKMFAKNCLYQSSTTPNLRSCNSYAKLINGKFIKISYFISSNKKNHCVCNIVNTVPHNLSNYVHVCLCEDSELISVDVKDIERLCVFMEIENLKFLSPRPNLLHY